MKFLVTYVMMTRNTRRRSDKSKTTVVDTAVQRSFRGITDPKVLEEAYETFYNSLNPNSPFIVKVIDTRSL